MFAIYLCCCCLYGINSFHSDCISLLHVVFCLHHGYVHWHNVFVLTLCPMYPGHDDEGEGTGVLQGMGEAGGQCE